MPGLYQPDYLADLQHRVSRLLPCWGLSSDSRLSLLCVSENATFLADDSAQDRKIVIRAYRPGYHTRGEMASEIQWIDALIDDGEIRTPRPLRADDGTCLHPLDEGDAPRLAVAFEFCEGKEPNPDGDLRASFTQLGEITARLHTQSRRWRTPDGFVRKTWDFATTIGDTPHWGDWRHAMGLDTRSLPILEKVTVALARALEQIGQSEDNFGLIHADLRLTNLLVDGDRLAVIDFDDCGVSWHLYDFAAAISFMETSPHIPELQAAWLQGYRTVQPLSQDQVDTLPTFVMLRRLLLTAWLASHSETPTARELGTDYTQGTVTMAETYLRGR